MPKYTGIERARATRTGQFVPDGADKIRPATTVRETIRIPRRKK